MKKKVSGFYMVISELNNLAAQPLKPSKIEIIKVDPDPNVDTDYVIII